MEHNMHFRTVVASGASEQQVYVHDSEYTQVHLRPNVLWFTASASQVSARRVLLHCDFSSLDRHS
jgi:hypothetical protein